MKPDIDEFQGDLQPSCQPPSLIGPTVAVCITVVVVALMGLFGWMFSVNPEQAIVVFKVAMTGAGMLGLFVYTFFFFR